MPKLTPRQITCLRFLTDKLFADSRMIGEQVWLKHPWRGSYRPSIGAGVAGSLRRKGLVTYLRDVQAWRITQEGRAALQTQT